MKKKVIALAISFIFLFAILIGCQKNENQGAGSATDTPATEEKQATALKVSMVTDTGGVNDESFNQSAWEGLERARSELGINNGYLESKQDADYVPNLEQLAESENDLIWGVGFKLADAILEAAEAYPDQKYGIIDYNYGDNTPENIVAVEFREHEAAFLVGYIAGKMTKKNNIGFVGGMNVPVIQRFQYGYKAGVQYAAKEDNKEIKMQEQIAESFDDVAKGRAITKQMIQQGADIVFHAAGGVGKGVIEEAKDQGIFAIGVDKDQNYLAPDTVITSAVKLVGQAMFDVTKELQTGEFKGGTTKSFGVAEGGVDFANTNDKVPQEVVAKAQELKQKIINKEVTVPPYEKEYNEFINKL